MDVIEQLFSLCDTVHRGFKVSSRLYRKPLCVISQDKFIAHFFSNSQYFKSFAWRSFQFWIKRLDTRFKRDKTRKWRNIFKIQLYVVQWCHAAKHWIVLFFKFVLREEVIKVPAVNSGRSQASVHPPICIINLWRRCVQLVVNSVKVCQKKKRLQFFIVFQQHFVPCYAFTHMIHLLVCVFVCIYLACWVVVPLSHSPSCMTRKKKTARKKWPRGHFFLAVYSRSSSTN